MSTTTPAVGYTVVLPPGWLRLDVRSDEALTEIDAAIDEAMAIAPRDRFGPLADQMRRRAQAMVERARDTGAVDLYLPLRGVRGRPVAASFVVAALTMPPPPPDAAAGMGAQDDVQLAAALLSTIVARTPGAGLVSLPAGPAARTEDVVEPEVGSDDPVVRRVDYHLPMPGDRGRVVVVSFTTAGGGSPRDDVSELLVDLFDALMTTWRWRPGLVI